MDKKRTPNPYDYDTLGAYCEELVRIGAAANHKAALALARKLIPYENKIQRQILAFVKLLPGGFFWKDAAGPYQQQGIPDIVGVYRGRFLAFEVKRPLLGELTAAQKKTLERINAAGGRAYMVTGIEDVKEAIRLAEGGDEI